MAEATGTDGRDRRRAGLVLYVDAEEALRRTVKTALEAFGFSVLLAGNGREGVEAFRQHAEEIRVVILDLNPSDRTGEAAVQEIRRLHPTARFLLLSGEAKEKARSRFPGMERVDFLRKPFQFVQLIERVQAACGKRRYIRLPITLPVIGRVPKRTGPELQGTLRRMGMGGLEVEFPEAVPPGSLMCVLLQTRRGPIAVEAKVVFARATGTAVRHGLAFCEPKDFQFVLDLFFRGSL